MDVSPWVDTINAASEATLKPSFISFGLITLDRLEIKGRGAIENVPGGSGLWSTLGARIATPLPRSKSIAYLLLIGNDFSAEVLENLEQWDVNIIVRQYLDEQSTRGVLKYLNEALTKKDYHYVKCESKLTPTLKDIHGLEWLHSPIMHFKCRPVRLRFFLKEIQQAFENKKIESKPLLIWEPDPYDCNKTYREEHLGVCKHVEVYSINHLDLKYLFEVEEFDTFDASKSFTKEKCECYGSKVYEAMINGQSKRNAAVVVRAGEDGALLIAAGPGTKKIMQWFPAYYTKAQDSGKVVDATGAGSTLLGAFGVTLDRTKDYRKAMMYGTVAASFAVEQIGLPTIARKDDGAFDETETWNGETFRSRLIRYGNRLA